MGWGRARREASLRHCGRNLSTSGWGGGRREASLRHCGRIFLRLRIPDGVWDGQEAAYGTAVGIFPSPDGVGEGSGEASLRHCGKNLDVSGWGAGRLGGKPAYGTAVGIYVSGWGGGGARRKSSLRHCGRIFFTSQGKKKGCRHRRRH